MTDQPTSGAGEPRCTSPTPFTLLQLVCRVNDLAGDLVELPPEIAHQELASAAVGLRAEMIRRGVTELEAGLASAQFVACVAEQLAYARAR